LLVSADQRSPWLVWTKKSETNATTGHAFPRDHDPGLRGWPMKCRVVSSCGELPLNFQANGPFLNELAILPEPLCYSPSMLSQRVTPVLKMHRSVVHDPVHRFSWEPDRDAAAEQTPHHWTKNRAVPETNVNCRFRSAENDLFGTDAGQTEPPAIAIPRNKKGIGVQTAKESTTGCHTTRRTKLHRRFAPRWQHQKHPTNVAPRYRKKEHVSPFWHLINGPKKPFGQTASDAVIIREPSCGRGGHGRHAVIFNQIAHQVGVRKVRCGK